MAAGGMAVWLQVVVQCAGISPGPAEAATPGCTTTSTECIVFVIYVDKVRGYLGAWGTRLQLQHFTRTLSAITQTGLEHTPVL